MEGIYYYDGRFVSNREAVIPLTDRSVYFGDAVYDACLVHRGRPYLLNAHLSRFYKGCRTLKIRPPMPKEALAQLLISICKATETEVAFLYFQASRDAETRRHIAEPTDGSHLLISLTPRTMPMKDKALRLITCPDRRYDYCNVKTVNLLPAVLASTKASVADADEAVFIRKGIVTECAHSNVSILKNGVLFTHPNGRRILPGISRKQLIVACKKLSIPVSETPFSFKSLMNADEVFVTSSSRLCQRASTVNGRPVGFRNENAARCLLDTIFKDFIS